MKYDARARSGNMLDYKTVLLAERCSIHSKT